MSEITYRLTLRTLRGGPVRHLKILGGASRDTLTFSKNIYLPAKTCDFKGGPVKKTTLYVQFQFNNTFTWPHKIKLMYQYLSPIQSISALPSSTA